MPGARLVGWWHDVLQRVRRFRHLPIAALTASITGVALLLAALGVVLIDVRDPASDGRLAASAAVSALGLVAVIGATVLWVREWQRMRLDAARVRLVAGQTSERIAVLSHEIRTPLSLIKGAGDLLAEGSPGALNPRQRSFVETITDNAQNLVDLAEDLLTQSRIDAGMFDMEIAMTDLRSLGLSTVRELRRLHRVEIAFDCPGAPPRMPVDRRLIRQAITNLVNNAVKASPDASTVSVRILYGDGGATITVGDNGAGIGDAERSRLFERFVSGHPLRDGTGIGLVITRQIALMHGGALHVDTVAGRGTTIIMTLPDTRGLVDDDSVRSTSSPRR